MSIYGASDQARNKALRDQVDRSIVKWQHRAVVATTEGQRAEIQQTIDEFQKLRQILGYRRPRVGPCVRR